MALVHVIWLGISIGMHAFPSIGDSNVLWEEAKRSATRRNLLALCSFPLVLFIDIVNVLRFFWVDSIYGAAIGLGLPELLLRQIS